MRTLFPLLVAIAVSACSATSSSPSSPATSDSKSTEVSAKLPEEINGYNGWTKVADEAWEVMQDNSLAILCSIPPAELVAKVDAFNKGTKEAHHLFINVYLNALASPALTAAEPYELPEGSVIVKEKHDAKEGPPIALGVMVKRARGFDPTLKDWEFLYIDGPTMERVQRGDANRCGNCHATRGRTDFLFLQRAPSWTGVAW